MIEDESGWDAFCDEHFEEALKYIKERFEDKGYGINHYLYRPCEDEPEDECGYPDCNKYPTMEILWVRIDSTDDISSKYIELE